MRQFNRRGCRMRNVIISLIFLLFPVVPAVAATAADLKDTAPERYIVIKGDTLWDISGRYLKEPWRWPELWKMNQDQIRNPHRIYPGDVLVLEHTAAGPQLRVTKKDLDTVKLSPRVRVESTARPIPSISPAAIDAWLSKPLVLGETELDSAARIIATQESRVVLGTGNIAYVEGISKSQGDRWHLVRRGDALIDPETGNTLGYLGIYVGEARVVRHGDVSTIEIVKAVEEIYRDDRLLPASKEQPVFSYVPHAPQKPVRARIVSAYPNLFETGPRAVVALSKGSNDGLRVGTVLAILRSPQDSRYPLRTSPLYGEQGLGGTGRHEYRGADLRTRDAPIYSRGEALNEDALARLPVERYGLVMVFRTFDRAAFALVMEASRPVSLNDVATNP
jgi:hypothetical protein